VEEEEKRTGLPFTFLLIYFFGMKKEGGKKRQGLKKKEEVGGRGMCARESLARQVPSNGRDLGAHHL
jgi:hypothetical protein